MSFSGSSLGGAVSGAATGASVGSFVPGIGTAIGAGVGGLIGLFAGRNKRKKLSTFDKNQKNVWNQYNQGVQGQGPMAGLFNFDANAARANFDQTYAQPAYKKFQEEVIPGITGQFRGGNLQNSSYLGGALAKAGTDVQTNLNANLSNMLYQGQQSSIDRRLQALNQILGTQTQAYEQPQASPFQAAVGGLAQGAGQYFANKYAG